MPLIIPRERGTRNGISNRASAFNERSYSPIYSSIYEKLIPGSTRAADSIVPAAKTVNGEISNDIPETKIFFIKNVPVRNNAQNEKNVKAFLLLFIITPELLRKTGMEISVIVNAAYLSI